MTVETRKLRDPKPRRVVVAIGASAGGLSPLQDFFGLMPADTGLTFVVIQHLSPDYDSAMKELLARHTTMPIEVAKEGLQLAPNTVYLNPAKMELEVIDKTFSLHPFDTSSLRFPINTFFRSMAADYGPDAVAIVLSGTGSDGSEGLQAVQRMEGLTIAQSVQTAQFDGMPKNAIATGAVDYTLSPAATAHLIREHAVSPVLRPSSNDSVEISNPNDVQVIFGLLSDAYDIDFSHYKPSTVSRRIDRRLQISRFKGLTQYVEVLQNDREELANLYHDLLIGVTCFFRDRDAFRALNDELDSTIGNSGESETLRIWCAGCATGEEAYSIAMMVTDLFESRGIEPRFKIFATDIHEKTLDIAARGIFSVDQTEVLTDKQRDEFFERINDDEYKVRPSLRRHLVFARQNVANDPPFTQMHLITCRNMLIYLQDDAQLIAIASFRFALKPNGLLMLGPSETLGRLSEGFDVVHKGWRLFRKNSQVRLNLEKRISATSHAFVPRLSTTQALVSAESAPPIKEQIALRVLHSMLDAAILIDSQHRVLAVFGDAVRLLPIRSNQDGVNLMVAFDGVQKVALYALISQALRDVGVEHTTNHLEFPTYDGKELFNVTARAIAGAIDNDTPVVLIQFIPIDELLSQITPQSIDESVRAELIRTRESLGASIEELESNNEEMQSTNEEMVASNEELQATNEELQSVNEELHTVNIEHQRKVQELQEMTDDFNNLFNSTNVGLILLDNAMRIRKFTKSANQYFNLLQHDLGRPLSNFAPKFDVPEFFVRVREVMKTETPFYTQTKLRDDHLATIEISPFQKHDEVDGVIISMIDISAAGKLAETAASNPDARAEIDDSNLTGGAESFGSDT